MDRPPGNVVQWVLAEGPSVREEELDAAQTHLQCNRGQCEGVHGGGLDGGAGEEMRWNFGSVLTNTCTLKRSLSRKMFLKVSPPVVSNMEAIFQCGGSEQKADSSTPTTGRPRQCDSEPNCGEFRLSMGCFNSSTLFLVVPGVEFNGRQRARARRGDRLHAECAGQGEWGGCLCPVFSSLTGEPVHSTCRYGVSYV